MTFTLTQRLTSLKRYLPSMMQGEMEACILIAENMDRLAGDPDAHTRLEAPGPSFGNVTEEDLNKGQRDVLKVFKRYPMPMDERTLAANYMKMWVNIEGADMKFHSEKVSTIRARRSDLEKRGMVVKVDDLGKSETGRKAGRYQVAPEYIGETA